MTRGVKRPAISILPLAAMLLMCVGAVHAQDATDAASKKAADDRQLQEKLASASAAFTAGDYDTAIAAVTDATQIDATSDILWFKLGDAYYRSVAKQTDESEKAKRLEGAVAGFQKSVDVFLENHPGTLSYGQRYGLAQYCERLGTASAAKGEFDRAIQAFTQAAHADSDQSSKYYFKLGRALDNANKNGDTTLAQKAVDALSKAILITPSYANAYYLRSVNLLYLDQTQAAAADLEKYLESAPDGEYVQQAKQQLQKLKTSASHKK